MYILKWSCQRTFLCIIKLYLKSRDNFIFYCTVYHIHLSFNVHFNILNYLKFAYQKFKANILNCLKLSKIDTVKEVSHEFQTLMLPTQFWFFLSVLHHNSDFVCSSKVSIEISITLYLLTVRGSHITHFSSMCYKEPSSWRFWKSYYFSGKNNWEENQL